MSRGYYGIGVLNGKIAVNIGTLWRSAYIFNADFIFTIGRRYKKQASDTLKSYRHVPLWNFKDFDDFRGHIPYDCIPILIELSDKSKSLSTFKHPERAVYILGAEDNGIPEKYFKGHSVIQIDTQKGYFCLNVAVAGSIVMYDRYIKSQRGEI